MRWLTVLLLFVTGCSTAPASDAGGTPTTAGPVPDVAEQAARVDYVVDGDTLALTGGEHVRLVGIDTPERGECGYEAASRAMARLVLHQSLTLSSPVDDQDRYDRLLRYVDVGTGNNRTDVGLELIRSGLAVARYDSRDGYDRHPRESLYRKADRASPDFTCGARG